MKQLLKEMTNGECYDPAMKMTDPAEAGEWLKLLVERHIRGTGLSYEEAEKIERSNLGYWAGYYSEETRQRVEKLFNCEHPIFGSIERNGPPTFTQALTAGFQMGRDQWEGSPSKLSNKEGPILE